MAADAANMAAAFPCLSPLMVACAAIERIAAAGRTGIGTADMDRAAASMPDALFDEFGEAVSDAVVSSVADAGLLAPPSAVICAAIARDDDLGLVAPASTFWLRAAERIEETLRVTT